MILFFRCTHWIVSEIQVYNLSIKKTYYNILVWQPLVCCADNAFFMVIVVNTYRYHYYSGMNIHKSQLWLDVNRRGTRVLTHPHLQFGGQRLCSLGGGVVPLPWWPFCVANCNEKTVQDEKHKDWWLMLLSQSTYIVHKWRVLICHEDKVYVITPINILFRGGDNFWPLMKVKLMFLPHATYCSEGVANFNVMMIVMWWCDDVVMMMMMMMMIMMIMTIVSVEQRLGWGEQVPQPTEGESGSWRGSKYMMLYVLDHTCIYWIHDICTTVM